MEPGELAGAIYESARLSPREAVMRGAFAIAERLEIQVYEQPRARAEVALAWWNGCDVVVIRDDLEPQRANFLVALAVAKMVAREEGLAPSRDDLAREAAWLVAPPEPFARRYHQVGIDLAALAQPFAITRTAAVLRLAEVCGLELVVVGKRAIHRRSPRLLGKLPDAELRALAARRAPRSYRRISLRDDGAAVALIAC